jgi:hypothetical protein
MRVILTTLAALSIAAFAQNNVCMSYAGNNFTLLEHTYKNDKQITKKIKVDNIKLFFFKERSPTKPIALAYSVNNHTKYYKYIYCNKEGAKEWCGIECDGGGFYLDKNYNIQIKYALRVGAGEDEESPYLELEQSGTKGYIEGKSFTCPKVLPRVKDTPDEKYYKDNANGKYVCYNYKSDSKYNGCFRSVKRCRDLHMQHFGKYSDKKSVKAALKRCQTSKPNSKYVDNSKGLYVCYDFKDSFNEYNGCFRALNSCKELNKKHFGHYPNPQESKKALARCQKSTPKK